MGYSSFGSLMNSDAEAIPGNTTVRHRICDTNVLLQLPERPEFLTVLTAGLVSLHVSPIAVAELVRKANPRSHPHVAKAAAWALAHCRILPSPEGYLETLWGRPTRRQPEWRWMLEAIADSHDFEELSSPRGVPNFLDRSYRRISLAEIATIINQHYDAFMTRIVKALDRVIPGYEDARRDQLMRNPNADEKAALLFLTNTPAVHDALVLATYERALDLTPGSSQTGPRPKRFGRVASELTIYVAVYTKYLMARGSYKPPDRNDWGDLDHFLYVRKGWQSATFESVWETIAIDAGHPEAVLRLRGI